MENEILLNLTSCRSHIRSLNRHVKDEECIKIWFEQLCKLLANVLYKIANYMKKEKDTFAKPGKETILLYLTQLTSSLSLLIQIFVRENTVSLVITEARNCVKKQLFWCLDGLEEVVNNDKNYADMSGSFIKWMDAALDQLAEIDLAKPILENVDIYKNARSITEEVLCHAMSIAQVALVEDCKIIKGSSQAVLDSLDSLYLELLKAVVNKPMCNLFVDCCNDKLCALERKVNEAVLKLCLKLFANYVEPLNQLHTFCLNNNDEEKLDMLIADFDTHVDQIMQVGLFAIACTTDSKYSVQMKSCLASLEALEVEIVPAFNSLLKDCSELNRNLSFLLKNYWIHQANALKNLIYLIIDPYAFAKVTYEEIESAIDVIMESMKKNNYIIDSNRVNDIINIGLVLDEMLITSIGDIPALDTPHIKQKLRNFKDVLYEVRAASTILDKAKTISARENSLRLIKRLKILLSVHKKLLFSLADDYEDCKGNEESIEKGSDNCNKEEQSPALDHLIVRGKQLIKDRSILYKTPINLNGNNVDNNSVGQRTPHIKHNGQNRPIPLLKLVHLRNMSYFNNSLLRNKRNDITAIDLQVTDILEELTSLGNSFK